MDYRTTKEWPFHIGCGGAVYKEENGQRLYALLYRGERFGARGNTWHLPKGTLSSEETLEACALREIKEESGFTVKIIGYLGTTHDQWVDTVRDLTIDKTVHYFLCRFIEGSSLEMDNEHDSVQWFNAKTARKLLASMPKHEAMIIERAEEYFRVFLNDNPIRTEGQPGG